MIRYIAAITLFILSFSALTFGSFKLLVAQDQPPFLEGEQIPMLLVGTEVTHQPPGGQGTVHLVFREDGKVQIDVPNGRRRFGEWRMNAPKVICLEGLGGQGQKNFCVMLVREGSRIHHYVPNSGEKMSSPPWVIVKPGPQAQMVPDG